MRFCDVLVVDLEVGSHKIYSGILTSLSAVLSLPRCFVNVLFGKSAMIYCGGVFGSASANEEFVDIRLSISEFGIAPHTSTPRNPIFLCVLRPLIYAIVAQMAEIDLLFLPRLHDCQ